VNRPFTGVVTPGLEPLDRMGLLLFVGLLIAGEMAFVEGRLGRLGTAGWKELSTSLSSSML